MGVSCLQYVPCAGTSYLYMRQLLRMYMYRDKYGADAVHQHVSILSCLIYPLLILLELTMCLQCPV